MTILEVLKQGINYPAPMATLQRVALVRGVDLDATATPELLTAKAFCLADADVKLWVSMAPNVSQSGISFDMLVSTRELLKSQANAVYREHNDSMYEPEKKSQLPKFGYKGKKL